MAVKGEQDLETVKPEKSSAGAEWVKRFLRPHLERRFPVNRAISCLQIAPDDPTEAEQLRSYGHTCEMVKLDSGQTLAFPENSFDFVFTGRFPILAPDRETRVALAKELHRVLKKGGSLLLVFGNRSSPIDLSRNGPLLHGSQSQTCLSLPEAEDVFIRQAKFTSVQPLNVYGHFGWDSLPAPLRPIGKALDLYWRFLVTPERRWLYSGALNPTLILWMNKG